MVFKTARFQVKKEALADEAAEHAHASCDAVRRFTSALCPRRAEPVEFTDYRVVAATRDG